MPPQIRIAITGATGFIGRALCARLRADGYRVRALVRTPSAAESLAKLGVELVPGDLANSSSLQKLVQDAGALIHCAASVRGSSQEAFNQVNIGGTRALLDATLAAEQPMRVIFLSSLAAREPQLSWYASSKKQSEELLLAAADRLKPVILRPPPVYGPGDKEMLPVFRMMKLGIALLAGSAEDRISLLHVDDLVKAICCCLQLDELPATPLTPTDPRANGYNWHEMAAIAEGIFQRRVRLVHPPRLLLDTVARSNLFLSRSLDYAPMLTPAKLRELRHPDWVASPEVLSRITGWTPEIDLQRGLAELAKTAL